MAWLVRAQAAGTVWAALFWLIVIFWGTALAGIVCAGGLLWWLGAGPWGAAAGSILGLLLAFGLRAWRLAAALPDHGFGFCPGLTQAGARTPALTDWLHAALQDIAFGPERRGKPLAFGDLLGPDISAPVIDLRMVATNLSMRQPHTLPKMRIATYFEENGFYERRRSVTRICTLESQRR
jgi:hypothetical protein